MSYYHVPKDSVGTYYAKFPVDFKEIGQLSEEQVREASFFSIKASTQTKTNSHNGNKKRTEFDIYKDTLEGKLGELSVTTQAQKLGYDVDVDFNNYGQGKWDSYDLKVFKNSTIESWQIKTSKSFSQLFLLEEGDYGKNGIYKYNKQQMIYNKFFLQRIKINDNRILNDFFYRRNQPDSMLSKVHITYDIARFLTYDELVNQIIKENQILKAGWRIKATEFSSNSCALEVNNYYAQLCDMHPITKLGE